MIRLRREVEKAKQALSSQKSVRIEIESLHPGGQDLSEELTRSQFEDLNMDLFRRAIATIDRAIEDTDGRIKDKDDIQDVILSGGPFNIPFLRSAMKDYFGEKKRYHGLNHLETASVFGAATIGQSIEDAGNSICCSGVAPLSVGIETAGGVMFKFMDRRSDGSFDRTFTFSTAMDNQDRVAIRVFDGERALASQNTFLGGIELSGILPAPK
ncbi:ATPase with role in protein import into the ER, partial [Linnemannia zychae]